MTTRTEWLAALQGRDRVTLDDVILTAQAYASTPPVSKDEPAVFLAFLEGLVGGLRPVIDPDPEPIEPTSIAPATAPETAPTEEVTNA